MMLRRLLQKINNNVAKMEQIHRDHRSGQAAIFAAWAKLASK